MFEQSLKLIDGVALYPLFSLILFFIFFLLVVIWFIKVDKKYIEEMEKLPLEIENKQNKKLKISKIKI